jgi:hypothetical protein
MPTRRLAIAFSLLVACGGPAVTPPQPTARDCPDTKPGSEAVTAPPPRDTDEGMWLLNAFPSERVKQKYGFGPTQAWLDHVRLSSLRLTLGCSGSVVSPNGLVMTNHHCASECLSELSTARDDISDKGLTTRSEKEERKCPGMEVSQLIDITDVTERVKGATRGASDAEFHAKQRAERAKIEKDCAPTDDLQCEVVNLYHGGQYHLYKYRRFEDIRLVFAPELAIAFFGGDPDNFNFPRYNLDVTFLRIYENDKPAKLEHHLKWSAKGPKEGDLTFVSGHPGGTSRLLTMAELVYHRDVKWPEAIARLAEERGVLTEFRNRGRDQKRIGTELLFGVENSLKAIRGMLSSLDVELMAQKAAEERYIRAKVAADPALAKEVGGAWEAIAGAVAAQERIARRYAYLEDGRGFQSRLFDIARTLVRAADELPRPNAERLEEFGDSRLPGVKLDLFSNAPIHAELETLTLGMSLTWLREQFGADDPVVRKVLDKEAPKDLAAALVKGTKLGDPKVRKALWEGGKAAIDAAVAKDPLLALARAIDAESRAIRAQYEKEVAGVMQKNQELVARARFAAFGTSVYPDATFTLRLAFGSVKGWNEGNAAVTPFTTMGGAFERATGKEPFALPASWHAAKDKLDLSTPFNFVSTNDIIGGNSGSPVINKEGEVVGLIFDGNIHSLGGEYWFDDVKNRAVSVDTAALTEALGKIYGAQHLVTELTGGK